MFFRKIIGLTNLLSMLVVLIFASFSQTNIQPPITGYHLSLGLLLLIYLTMFAWFVSSVMVKATMILGLRKEATFHAFATISFVAMALLGIVFGKSLNNTPFRFTEIFNTALLFIMALNFSIDFCDWSYIVSQSRNEHISAAQET